MVRFLCFGLVFGCSVRVLYCGPLSIGVLEGGMRVLLFYWSSIRLGPLNDGLVDGACVANLRYVSVFGVYGVRDYWCVLG